MDLHASRARDMGSPQGISYQEIALSRSVYGRKVYPVQVAAIRELDKLYLSMMAEQAAESADNG